MPSRKFGVNFTGEQCDYVFEGNKLHLYVFSGGRFFREGVEALPYGVTR